MSVIRNEKVDQYLDDVCFFVKNKKVHESIKEELYAHIDEITEEYIAQGKTEESAIDKALLQMGEPMLIGKSLNKVHKTTPDWVLLGITIAFVLFGIFTLGFMERNNATGSTYPTNYLYKTLLFAVIGGILAFMILRKDYRNLKKYSKPIYIGTLIASCFPLISHNCMVIIGGIGMHDGWITISMLTFNIYYLALFLLVLSLSGIFVNLDWSNYKNIAKGFVLGFGPCIIFIMIPRADILAIYTISIVILMMVSGLKIRYILIPLSTLSLFTFAYIIKEPYRWERFTVFLDPKKDALGAGWIYNQLTDVRKSTTLFGHGANFNPNKLPEINTDFIFSYIIYSFGWITGILLIAVFLAFIIRIGFIGMKTKDNYGKVLVCSICALFFAQFAINILMNLALSPIFSVSLPFISYGGSSLIFNMLSVGLITSVYRWRNSPYTTA